MSHRSSAGTPLDTEGSVGVLGLQEVLDPPEEEAADRCSQEELVQTREVV